MKPKKPKRPPTYLKVCSHLRSGGIDPFNHNRRLLVLAYGRTLKRYVRVWTRLRRFSGSRS